MDFKRIRDDFPIFSKMKKTGKKFVYLDNAATTQKSKPVVDSVVDFYTLWNSNVHRGLYDSGERATALYEESREKIAKFINAADTSEIIFTKGTTESINFISQTWAMQNLKPGDEVLLTQAEHHANLLPWQRITAKTGTNLRFIPIDSKTFRVKEPQKFLTPKTKLLAVVYVSNVLCDIWEEGQLEELISLAKKQGVKILIDAAQVLAHRQIDVQKLDVDFLAFSGHKMFGPTGIGVLYIRRDLQDQIEPYQVGGGMVSSVDFDGASWAPAPQKFEAGTPPIAQAIGLGSAVDYITQNINFKELKKYEMNLCGSLVEKLRKFKSVRFAGDVKSLEKCRHLISFAVDGVHAHDIAGFIGEKGISVRAGHHCAQPLVRMLDFESLVRVSFAVYNTLEDVENFVSEFKESLNFFGIS